MLPAPGDMGTQDAWVVEAISGLEHEHQDIQAEAWKPKRRVDPDATVNAVDATKPVERPKIQMKRPKPKTKP